MSDQQKLLGDERRQMILHKLRDAIQPLTGTQLAELANVSRQVIVQDISLLKAAKAPIVATSQGYMYLTDKPSALAEMIIASKHTFEETENELNLIVDQGASIKNVIIDHPLYGEITASLMLSSRRDVMQFMQKLKETNASLLSELTEGIHLHTIQAENETILDVVVQVLNEAGYLL